MRQQKISDKKQGERDIKGERDKAMIASLAPPAVHSKQRAAPSARARFAADAKGTREPCK